MSPAARVCLSPLAMVLIWRGYFCQRSHPGWSAVYSSTLWQRFLSISSTQEGSARNIFKNIVLSWNWFKDMYLDVCFISLLLEIHAYIYCEDFLTAPPICSWWPLEFEAISSELHIETIVSSDVWPLFLKRCIVAFCTCTHRHRGLPLAWLLAFLNHPFSWMSCVCRYTWGLENDLSSPSCALEMASLAGTEFTK